MLYGGHVVKVAMLFGGHFVWWPSCMVAILYGGHVVWWPFCKVAHVVCVFFNVR